MPHLGQVFQLTSDEGGNHFWVVISPVVDGLVLAVNITDFRNCPDSPCVFEAGIHDVITKRSVAFYRKAKEFEACKIDKFLEEGKYLRRLQDFPPELRRFDNSSFPPMLLSLMLLSLSQICQ